MAYIISKVLKRIKNNIRQYTFVFVQILIGILIMTVFLSVNFSINKDYKKLESKAENNLIKLNIYNQQNNDNLLSEKKDMPSPFDLSDYNVLKKNYADKLKIAYLTKTDINLITTIKGESGIDTANMFFASEEFFELYYPKVKINNFDSANVVFIGEKALEMLKNDKVAEGNVNIHKELILPDKLILKNGDTLKIVEINIENGFDNKQLLLDVSNDSLKINLDNAIIFPAKYLSTFKMQSATENTFVSLKLSNSSYFSNVGIGVINYLYSKNQNKYDYCYDTLTEEYVRQTNGYKILAVGLSILSAFVMVIIIVGLTGIFLIIVNRRIGEYAISMTLGATRSKIFLETILESVIVTSLGGLTGVILSICVLKYMVNFKQFNIYINSNLLLFSLAVSIFIGVISSVLPIIRIKQIAPIEIIRRI